MRIAFVTGHYAPFAGGVESHVEQIAVRLARRGDDVTVLTQSDRPDWPVLEVIGGVTVQRFRVPIPSRHFALSPALGRHLRRTRSHWDVVHVHGYHSITPLLATLAGARPMVFTPHYHGTGHSTTRRQLHRPYRLAGQLIVQASTQVICVSEAERALLVKHFPSAQPKTSVIPNGVDLEQLMAAEPAQMPGRFVLSAGRLESYKHVDDTLRAMAALEPGYRLGVTGDGPDRRRLEAVAADLGLGERVRFAGRLEIDELYSLYRRADVYVSMSSNEAMPVTILELLACGARVVASDIPAHRDIAARTGGPVTIVPLRPDPQQLAQAIRDAADHMPDRRGDVPTWDEVTELTRAVYEAAVNGAR